MKVLKLFSKIFMKYLRLTTTLIMGIDLIWKQKHMGGENVSINFTKAGHLVFIFFTWSALGSLVPFQSWKQIYNHNCLFVRPSICPSAKPSTASNHHPSSFILHHSSFILHYSSSFFIHPSFILQLLSFSACLPFFQGLCWHKNMGIQV